MTFSINREDEMKAGVYCIICYPTGDMYIGSTSRLLVRYNQHLQGINNSNRGMYKKIRAMGSWNFSFELFDLCEHPEARLNMERGLIAGLRPSLNGYGGKEIKCGNDWISKNGFAISEAELNLVKRISKMRKSSWFAEHCQISTHDFRRLVSTGAGSDSCIKQLRHTIATSKDLKHILRRLSAA